MTALSRQDEYAAHLEAAAQFIRENDHFLVVSHIHPDGDAAGSTYAVAWMLTALGKQYTLINEGNMPEKFRYMGAGQQTVVDYEASAGSMEASFTRVICVDCADFSRMGSVSQLLSADVKLLNIDHHATNDRFGSCNLVVDTAAATVEVLYDLCMTMNIPFSHELNVCLYSGLLTDTGGFRYSNTSPKVMRIAADMLERGVKGHELAEHLLEKLSYPQIALIKSSLSSLKFAHGNQVAWLSVTLDELEQSGASNEDLDGLVNYPRSVEGVEVGILFKERKDMVKVSLRSNGKVDVAQVAKAFGGGGHVRAAGCAVEGTLDEAIERVVKEVGLALG